MASIRKRGTRWQARIARRGMKPIGRTFADKRSAEKWARAVEIDIDEGRYNASVPLERITVSDIISRYEREVTPAKRGKGEPFMLRTLASSDLGLLPLASLTAPSVASYRDKRLASVKPGTVIRELGLLGAVLSHARREWALPIPDVVGSVRKPSPPRGRDRVLDLVEEARLLDGLPSGGRGGNLWLKPIVMLALETAMRRGELLSMKWINVDLKKRTALLEITKNGDSRTVPLSMKAIAVLQELPRSIDGRVFPITANSLKAAWQRAVARTGLADLRFHDLRHTATSRLAAKLPNVIELGAVTGHKDVRMLQRYYHCRAEDLALKIG